jgi:hypothetical protein
MYKFWLVCLALLCFPKSVYAVSVSILSAPTSAGEDKFSVTVKTEGASAGTNYLRVDLYTPGTTKYFGETDNTQSWYGGSDGKQYFPITIVSGTPNIATVSARLGEPTQSDYPGPGSYKLRIRRYTSSGGQGSEDPQPVDITLTKTWPSASPSPTALPSSSPSPSPVSTATPVPSSTQTPKPSLKPSTSPSPSPEMVGVVAGESTEIDLSGFGNAPSPSLSPSPSSSSKSLSLNKTRAKTVIMLGGGLILTSLASYMGYRLYTRKKPSSPL